MGNKDIFPYIHGFSEKEQDRLREQASFAEYSLFKEVNFKKSKKILEVGCGVGAQTEILLRRFPECHVTGIDLNSKQLKAAKDFLKNLEHLKGRYKIKKMNALEMSFEDNSFDGAYLCWVLEHIPNPEEVLGELKRVLRPGSKVYVTEVLNSAFFLDPYSPNIWKFWTAFNDFQFDTGGDPFVGAKLGNFLKSKKFKDIKVNTITWHLDNRNPELRKEYMEYWFGIAFSASEQLLNSGYIDKETYKKAKNEMKKILKNENAVIFDCFIQASATA